MEYRYRDAIEMKDSGVEWIGKIPSDWTISRIDKEFNVRNEKVSDKVYPPLSVTKQGILPQLDNVAKSDNGDNRKKVCVGDFVINSRADRKGSCGVSIYNGSVSLICNVLTPKRLHPQYVHNLFRNYYFSEEFYRWGSGIVDDLWSTNIEKMKKINIPIPMDKEDEKIANFLDKKTSHFDSIISKKEVLIEKLEEAKKSLVSEVVTGKVKVVKTDDGYELVKRSSYEMKDSGVEWLGEIPKDWEVKKVKHVASLKSGDSITSNNIKDEGIYPVYGGNGLRGYTSNYTHSGKYILIGRQGALCGNINYASNKFWASEHAVVVNPIIDANLTWLGELLRSMNLNQYSVSAAQPGLAVGMIENLYIPYTSIKIQNTIAKYIDEKVKNMEYIVNKTKRQIEKLKEAKQSLISEAVTVKIEILD